MSILQIDLLHATARWHWRLLVLGVAVLVVSTAEAQIPNGAFLGTTKVGPLSGVDGHHFVPVVSGDDLTLYFADSPWVPVENQIEGGFGSNDMWMATRTGTDEPFGPIVNLGPSVNTAGSEIVGSVSPDNLTMYFSRATDVQALSDYDMFVATRNSTNDLFANPQSLGPLVNTSNVETQPRVAPDGLTLVYLVADRGTLIDANADLDVWMATRESITEPFGSAAPLSMNTTDNNDWFPSISTNGLSVFTSDFVFQGPRSGSGNQYHLWVSTRERVDGEFPIPVRVDQQWPESEVTTPNANSPYISPNWPAPGSKLYWAAQPPGGAIVELDIYQATWTEFPTGDCTHDGVVTTADLECQTDIDTLVVLQDQLDVIPGDFDGLNGVDFGDFLRLSQHFGQTADRYGDGDIDLDGTTDFSDFLVLSQNFGRSAMLVAVPEPSAALLLLMGVLATLRFRRIAQTVLLPGGGARIAQSMRRLTFPIVATSLGLWLYMGSARGDIYKWQLSEIDRTPEESTELVTDGAGVEAVPGSDLSGLNLREAWLNEANLQDANLSDAELSHANLQSASLQNANLRNTGLGVTNLRDAVLDGADLTNAYMSHADLRDASLKNTTLVGVNLSGAEWSKTELTGADFSGANIAHVDLFHTNGFTADQLYSTASYRDQDLQGINFRGLDLTSWNFNGQDLTDSSFWQSNLRGVKFRDAHIGRVDFDGALHFTPEQLYATHSYKVRRLHGTELSDLNLSGWDFSNQDLTEASFHESNLADANFLIATVDQADFSHATGFTSEQLHATANHQRRDYRGISFDRTNLVGANFIEADLTSTSFTGAGLRDADFTGSRLRSTDLSNTTSRGFSESQLQATESFQSGSIYEMYLGQNNLSGWDFSGLHLNMANFGLSNLRGANFRSSNLSGASIRTSPTPTVESSSDEDLAGADFTNAIVASAEIGFDYAQLQTTKSFQDRDLRGIVIRRHHGGWDLSGQDLSYAEIDFSDWTGVDLTDARINDASLGGWEDEVPWELFENTASYKQQDLRGIHAKYQEWRDRDLSNQNLARANFTGSDLTGSNLSNASLQNAELKRTRLSSVDFENTDLTGANLYMAQDFAPTDSTITRNMVWPDGTIQGLELESAETFALLKMHEGATVHETFTTAPDSVVEVEVFACAIYGLGNCFSKFIVADGTEVDLNGTLRIKASHLNLARHYGVADWLPIEVVSKFDFFDWSEPVAPENQFSKIEVPAGTIWDFSNLYTSGEAVLLEVAEIGDFNANGVLDANDLDRLSAAMREGGDLSYDLNPPNPSGYYRPDPAPIGWLDAEDRRIWVEDLKGTYSGDSDLDGVVAFTDFLALSSNFNEEGGWAEGDFDGNGRVEFADFTLLSSNFGRPAKLMSVPEPSVHVLLWMCLTAILGLRGRLPFGARRPSTQYVSRPR